MTCDIILTTSDDGNLTNLYEKKLGKVRVSRNTNMRELFTKLALKHFGEKHNVRRDNNVFGWVAVSADGDTITIA